MCERDAGQGDKGSGNLHGSGAAEGIMDILVKKRKVGMEIHGNVNNVCFPMVE